MSKKAEKKKTEKKKKESENKKEAPRSAIVGSSAQEEQLKKLTEKKKGGALSKEISFGSGVSKLDISLAMRHISIMLKSGMALAEALIVMAEQSHSQKLQDVFIDIYQEVQMGNPMSAGMRKHPKVFDKTMISIIDVGEQGGTLERNLLFLAEFLKENHELNSKVKGALMYPVIVFVITIAEMLGVLFFILPKLEELFKSFDNIPPFTKAIMDGATLIREYFIVVVIVTIVVGILAKIFLNSKYGHIFKDWLSLRFPIIKNLKRYHILTNFSRTLGILLESGIPIVAALEITTETMGNVEYERIIKNVHEKVEGGASLAASLEGYSKHFPGTYVKMIQVGEETASLENNLTYLYEFYAGQVRDMSNNLATLLEPILLVFIGLMIGALAILIIAPIYQLTGNINEAG